LAIDEGCKGTPAAAEITAMELEGFPNPLEPRGNFAANPAGTRDSG